MKPNTNINVLTSPLIQRPKSRGSKSPVKNLFSEFISSQSQDQHRPNTAPHKQNQVSDYQILSLEAQPIRRPNSSPSRKLRSHLDSSERIDMQSKRRIERKHSSSIDLPLSACSVSENFGVNKAGIPRALFSNFSPIPGSPDGKIVWKRDTHRQGLSSRESQRHVNSASSFSSAKPIEHSPIELALPSRQPSARQSEKFDTSPYTPNRFSATPYSSNASESPVPYSLFYSPGLYNKSHKTQGIHVESLSFPSSLLYQDIFERELHKKLNLVGWFVQDSDLEIVVALATNRLRSLDLSGSEKLTSKGIGHLNGLTRLESLNLSGCISVSDESLKLLSTIHTLQHFDISNCPAISDDGVKHLARGCRALTSLCLAHCKHVSDTSMQYLANRRPPLQPLTSLDITGCSLISDQGLLAYFSSLFAYDSIKQLKIGTNLLTDVALMGLAPGSKCCRTLELLSLQDMNAGDTAMSWIAQSCPNLVHLHLIRLQHSFDCAASSIGDLSQLSHLSIIDSTHLSDDALIALFCSTRPPSTLAQKLLSLNLSLCPNVTDRGIQAIGMGCVNLTSLTLKSVGKLSDEGLCAISMGCPLLQELDCSSVGNSSNPGVRNYYGVPRISDTSVRMLLTKAPQLRVLKLCGLAHFVGKSLRVLASGMSGCTGLREISFAGCDRLSSAAISSILPNLPNLTILDLAGCVDICDDLLETIAMHQCSLSHLNLFRAVKITDQGINVLVKSIGRFLEFLHLGACKLLSDDSLLSIAETCHKMQVLNLVGLHRISDIGVKAIAQSLGLIHTLRVHGCPCVTKEFLQEISVNLPLARLSNGSKLGLVPRALAPNKVIDTNRTFDPKRERGRGVLLFYSFTVLLFLLLLFELPTLHLLFFDSILLPLFLLTIGRNSKSTKLFCAVVELPQSSISYTTVLFPIYE